MKAFQWNQNFLTGIKKVAEQHHNLVNLTNKFGSLLAENKININEIKVIFQELVDYSLYHFKEEEVTMRQVGVDPRHVKKHLKIHSEFLNDASALYSEISAKNIKPAYNLLSFLSNWIAYHILGCDQNMARQIKAIQAGKTPAQAYEQEDKNIDSSTAPLLSALDELFKLVSVRNKELMKLNQSLEKKVEERTEKLSQANLKLQKISVTDRLTGLPNRRYAMQYLPILWNESIANGTSLLCMMIDADHFKEINDNFGHDKGDLVLKELAKTLQYSFRTDDIVCRLGGDEFFAICPNTSLNGGMYLADEVRGKVA